MLLSFKISLMDADCIHSQRFASLAAPRLRKRHRLHLSRPKTSHPGCCLLRFVQQELQAQLVQYGNSRVLRQIFGIFS